MEHQYSPSFWCQPDGEGTEEARCARSLFLIPVARSKARALHIIIPSSTKHSTLPARCELLASIDICGSQICGQESLR
ncbi:BQ5605_C036g11544 [Microbotryum silenes-dioicae]|uniref:BQ5605_C036g11544 protein n=1 Tax=Microbotryum silenes-dioicae TaxID=796604 RepID=A0A2X0MIW5_9BASI|nr:BQ5605_C036g11544 [Microbotryum silenes-dioicae]